MQDFSRILIWDPSNEKRIQQFAPSVLRRLFIKKQKETTYHEIFHRKFPNKVAFIALKIHPNKNIKLFSVFRICLSLKMDSLKTCVMLATLKR